MAYRTPADRFEGLPAFPYAPRYVSVRDDLRMHYVDEGTGAPVLCLHGEPTWAYLYRHMIPPLAEVHRVVVPDFIGFGRSDKLTAVDAYSFSVHYEALATLIEALGLSEVTLVVQDWGGLLGLAYAARRPERIARLVVLNTFLPTGAEEKSPAFRAWRRFVENTPDLPISQVVRRGLAAPDRLSGAEAAAYDAPFPTAASKAGAVAWPLLVPMEPGGPVADAMRETRRCLAEWSKPAFVLFAPDDPILGGAREFFLDLLPTAREQPDVTIGGAGHFLQEERGPEIARHVLDFMARTA
ncbi:MAG: haloalkane dehalogenase [Salinibacter sp.]|uniref:haloalkane dehalogenase n=1 Tax=Salinibacter sp. TaxID=2065818 RepID=UPI0035D42829